MDTEMKFNPASAIFFMFIGGLITLIILGSIGALSQPFTEDTILFLAIAAIVLAAIAWAIDRFTDV